MVSGMTQQRSGLRLALEIALGDDIDGDTWLTERSAGGASLRTIAADVSEILGQKVGHTTIDNWLNAIAADSAA